MSGRRRLFPDRRGMAAVEFALVFPIMIMMTVGIMEFGLMMLMDASLELGIREASRAGSLTTITPDETQRKAQVMQIIDNVVANWVPGTSTITVDINVYQNLANIGSPTWVDGNGNGLCDGGEGTCPPLGVQVIPGVGTAGSLVLYTVTITRPGFTGVLKLAGINELNFRRQAIVVNE